MADTCQHLDTIEVIDLPDEIPGCEDCLKIGGWWVHLRMCTQCGHIGCCDNSPNRHATKHFRETEHPIIRSAEPGEDWSWCYVDELMLTLRPA
jgi:uncharacterized UBP type Zn finger protein